ncbi:MAG: hypothetical protein JWM43_768 [Acidobacteriaceae bacterium]|nr:hypothetical protein [Acidobacteriaceae bacterium]
MCTAEILLEDFDAEMAGTRKTLERIPEDKPDYKPHEKSMICGKLAMHVAALPLFAKYILTEPGMDMGNSQLPRADLTFRTREMMLASFDAYASDARKALAAASDEDLAAKWKFSFGEHLISNESRSRTYRLMFFNHLIHHRAQLGVYLRLNEIPVPGLYGPSADEPFAA